MNISEKIFQTDSYLTTLESNVTSCTQKDDLYEIILDKTIFYPHMSGGQPKDEGTINNIAVIDVIESGNDIIHVLNQPLSGKVSLYIDFDIRFDHMQQHTGQHILSCAFGNLFRAGTIGFHLSSDFTTIDLDIKDLTSDMIDQIELYSNQIIYKNFDIKIQTVPYDTAIQLNLRKTPPKFDELRIVQISNKDTIACSGTHLNSTGEVGVIKIVKTEKYKAGVRVEFLCGKRALCDYMDKTKILLKLSTFLSCRFDMLSDNVDKIKFENRNLSKNIATLHNELDQYKANELKNNAVVSNGVNFIFQKLDGYDTKGLRFICSKIVDSDKYVVALYSENESTCNIVLGQSADTDCDLDTIFSKCSAIVNLKGGGNKKLMQGSGTILGKSEECVNLLRDHFLGSI